MNKAEKKIRPVGLTSKDFGNATFFQPIGALPLKPEEIT